MLRFLGLDSDHISFLYPSHHSHTTTATTHRTTIMSGPLRNPSLKAPAVVGLSVPASESQATRVVDAGSSSAAVANGNDTDNGNGVAAQPKPRARLGPTEVVILPSSDTEDEADADAEEGEGDEENQGKEDDFLKDYPDETEVSARASISRRYEPALCGLRVPQTVGLLDFWAAGPLNRWTAGRL